MGEKRAQLIYFLKQQHGVKSRNICSFISHRLSFSSLMNDPVTVLVMLQLNSPDNQYVLNK